MKDRSGFKRTFCNAKCALNYPQTMILTNHFFSR